MATVATNFTSWSAVKENVSPRGCGDGAEFRFMEVSSEFPRVPPPRDRVGDLPVFRARGVGHLPFIFSRG